MLNIGFGEMAVIAVAALLILGPQRLPELARNLGRFLREFRRQSEDFRATLESEFYRMDENLLKEPEQAAPQAQPVPHEQAILPPVTGPLDSGYRAAVQPQAQVAQPSSPSTAAAAPLAPGVGEGKKP